MSQKSSTYKEDQTIVTALDWSKAVARLTSERNCTDLVILDVQDISPVTNYIVIATGTSDRQLVAIASELKTLGKHCGHRPWLSAGQDSGQWVVIDFVDVVVHLFSQDLREYYDLELIWGDAKPIIDWAEDEPETDNK